MITLEDIRRLANSVGMERLLIVVGAVSGLTVLVLIFGTFLIGFWAGFLGALIVLAAFYLAMQRVLQRLPGAGSKFAPPPAARMASVITDICSWTSGSSRGSPAKPAIMVAASSSR